MDALRSARGLRQFAAVLKQSSVAQTRPAELRAAANCRSPRATLRYVPIRS